MRICKKMLSIMLVVIMLAVGVPMTQVSAENSVGSDVDSETTISAENGMENIIENLTETESESKNESNGYSISDVTFENNIAYVTVNVAEICKLVVAVYDEETLELITSATEELDASVYTEETTEDIISVAMGLDQLPEHFLAKAFILDENNNALCKNFICRTYTTAFEIFMETTPDDFAGEEIITFDENCDDFGVLVDDVIVSEKSEEMTYTYNDGVYTFYNPTDEVKNLKTDDILYYQFSDEIGDFLLIKVLTINIDGSTVTITENEEIDLNDAFQFIRIEEDADFTDITLNGDELGSALSIQEPEMQARAMSSRAEIDTASKKTFSTKLKVSYPNKKSDNEEAWKKGFSISGSFGYTLQASVKLYYDVRFGKDFYEFKTELTHKVSLNITFSGKIESNSEYFKLPIPSIPIGIFKLDISVYPVLSAGASMSLIDCSMEIYNRYSFTASDGLSKINDTKWLDGDVDLGETEIAVKVGLGASFDFGFKKGKKGNDGLSTIQASVAASFEGYIGLEFTPSLVGVLLDKHHDCSFCLTGVMTNGFSGTGSFKFKFFSDKMKWSWDAIKFEYERTIGNCYFSISGDGLAFGFGTCPNIAYQVVVTVYDENGDPVEDAVVSTTTGYCDADGDNKFNETSINTDENGQAVLYFRKGTHEVVAKKNGIGSQAAKFEILSNPKKVNLELCDAEYFNGRFYKVFDMSMTWTEAKAYCENMGGHLVTITSQNEQDFITEIAANSTKRYLFLGGILENEKYVWITGEDLNSYTNWNDGEPNNTYGIETVIMMYTAKDGVTNGVWNDTSPVGFSNNADHIIENYGFICEWETTPSNINTISYSMSPYSLTEEEQTTNETVVDGITATRNDVLNDAEYILAVIRDENAEELFNNNNLLYIDQKTAESSIVSFEFVLPKGVTDYTVKIYGVSHTHSPDEAVTENEVEATCKNGGSYEEVIYCSVCGEELGRETVATNAIGHAFGVWIQTIVPTCTENGEQVRTCQNCDYSESEILTATGHTFDGSKCVNCDYDKSANCACNCHKSGFMGFIWKILNFFYRIFRINKECVCGAYHW